jgi:hypothetical protein
MNYLAQIRESDFLILDQVIGLRPEFRGASIGVIISAALKLFFYIAGLAMLLYLIYGGYLFMFSGGNPQSTAKAKSVLTTAVVGFIVVFAAFWIIQFLAFALGIVSLKVIFL